MVGAGRAGGVWFVAPRIITAIAPLRGMLRFSFAPY